MAEIFNEQRVLGVVLVDDGAAIYNNSPVIGVVNATGKAFVNNRRVLGVDILETGTVGIHNEQPIVGAVVIEDERDLYGYSPIVPVDGLPLGALDLLADEPNGLAIDFTDNSYAIRTSIGAEILLGSESGLGIDFVDDSYAMRTP